MKEKKKDPKRFYRGTDQVDYRFYKTSKDLYENRSYDSLSLGAKALYMVLADRLSLSLKNRMYDKEGYTYVLFKIKPAQEDTRTKDEKSSEDLSLSEVLNVTPKSIKKYKEELVNHDLLFEERVGQGRLNRLYVLKPNIAEVKSPKLLQLPRDKDAYKKNFPALFGGVSEEVEISSSYEMALRR